MAAMKWKAPPFWAGRITFLFAEIFSLIWWLTGSTQTSSDVGAVFFWAFVPYCALVIFAMHHAQLETKYAPEQKIYRRRFHLLLFILFLPVILDIFHAILGTAGRGSGNSGTGGGSGW